MKKSFFCFALAFIVLCVPSHAISIKLVYQDPLDPFFTADAKSTLDKASSDVSYAVTTVLNALTQNVYNGVNGATTAQADWYLRYTNPLDGSTNITINTFNFLQSEFTIFVGNRTLGGSTLGVGGPSGAGFTLSGSGYENEWIGAIENLEMDSNTGMVRGGPVLGTILGSSKFGNTTADYGMNYGYAVGTLAFDDTKAWNFDYNETSFVGLNDLYSVAIHEMLHTIGFGIGKTWNEQANGTDWNGSSVFNVLGTGTNVLYSDGHHIAEGLTGTPLIDGIWQIGTQQEAAMDPNLTVGTRKYITDLDLAFLQDMGWEVRAIPEPKTSVILLLSIIFLGAVRHRNIRILTKE